jgi:uncharacterized LabA/DUF88 family protein
MELKLGVFIDFWNFQLNWNSVFGKFPGLNWPEVPAALAEESRRLLGKAGSTDSVVLSESRVYASIEAQRGADAKLKRWLDTFLDMQPGIRVFCRERQSRTRAIHCPHCAGEIRDCPHCLKPLIRSVEKGVDSAIVTDLFSLAWDGSLNAAVLVSNDRDFVPAVERLQEKGFRIVNAAWRGQGHQLAKTCWASFYLNDVASKLRRP